MSGEADDACCSDSSGRAPVRENPPGQERLRYRIGTHPTFFKAMIQALPRARVTDDQGQQTRPLQALTTRALDDGSIALLDAWAAALDVLTFYQERILEEGYLATATQQRSVEELARVIGYEPGPGVAASARLAFSVDSNVATESVTVNAGLAVMSVPAQDELPQTFETSASLEARPEWNVLVPLQTQPHPIEQGVTDTLYLSGLATRLGVGDPVVIVGKERGADSTGSERWDLRFVSAVDLFADGDYTLVTLDRVVGSEGTAPAAEEVQVITFRGRASLFGHNAPDIRAMPQDIKDEFATGSGTSLRWDGFHMDEDPAVALSAIDLDREYSTVVTGSWVCMQDRTEVELYRVTKVSAQGREDFTLAGKCTRVFLDTDEHLDDFRRRATIVHIQSEELPVAEAPYGEPVSGTDIELDEVVTEMPAGRELIFAGKDADTGEESTEVAVVKSWDNSGANTVIRLEQALDRRYRRADLVIHGNVVAATHGSSVSEILGSGSGASAHQRFTLKAAPLTWVTASTSTGAQSTLEVRVDGVRWELVESLHEEGPTNQVYVMRRDENGYTQIEMGDGVHGARLPSGTNNVTARYRKGLGLDGEVDAGRLTLLQSRPQGLRGVSNPAAASGAANPETADETRENAPLGILTLDRLVSLQDYEDFARAFAGVGKAGASELWDGKRGFVHVTIASASGEELDEDAATVTALVEAFASYKDPAHVVVVSPHDQVLFGVQLKVVRDPDHLEADVEAAVRAALEQAFSFSMRRFGQSVTAAEVITVAQGAAGVVAVDLDALHREGESAVYNATLMAARAAWSGGGITRAELLLLGPELVTVGWMEA